MEPRDLLLADLDHFAESMWRNEEVGEKRLSFFVTLMTAVAAGLVALATSDPPVASELFRQTAIAGTGGLLVIGLLSYLRMLHRNRVTDQYQTTLKHIRDTVKGTNDLKEYDVPSPKGSPTNRWLRGGYAETFAVLDGMLLAGLLLIGLQTDPVVAAASGASLAFALVAIAALRKQS